MHMYELNILTHCIKPLWGFEQRWGKWVLGGLTLGPAKGRHRKLLSQGEKTASLLYWKWAERQRRNESQRKHPMGRCFLVQQQKQNFTSNFKERADSKTSYSCCFKAFLESGTLRLFGYNEKPHSAWHTDKNNSKCVIATQFLTTSICKYICLASTACYKIKTLHSPQHNIQFDNNCRETNINKQFIEWVLQEKSKINKSNLFKHQW